MLAEEPAAPVPSKKVKKEEKKSRKRAKKEAKKEAKRARKDSKKNGGSSSSSSDDEGGGPLPLPAAARWQGPAVAPAASLASLEAQLAAARAARVSLAQRGPVVGSSQIMPLRQSQAEVEMRGLRAARFEQTAAEKALAAAASRPVPKLPAGQVLRGKSQALEKSYLRLTSMPRADQAPPPCRAQTHAHSMLMHNCATPRHTRAAPAPNPRRTRATLHTALLLSQAADPVSLAGGCRCGRCRCCVRPSPWWASSGRRSATTSTRASSSSASGRT